MARTLRNGRQMVSVDFYKDFSYLVGQFEGAWSLDFLEKNQNSCRGPIFEISKGISNIFPGLYTNFFYVFCHSFWCTITLQRNLEIYYFRILSHCAVVYSKAKLSGKGEERQHFQKFKIFFWKILHHHFSRKYIFCSTFSEYGVRNMANWTYEIYLIFEFYWLLFNRTASFNEWIMSYSRPS